MIDWTLYVLDRTAPVDIDAISETVDWVFETLVDGGMIDFRLDVDRVNGEHLACALRCTYSMQERVKGWKTGLEIARQALIRDGVDPEDALIGLNEPWRP